MVVRHSIVLALVLSPKGGTRTRKGIDMFDHERRDVFRVGLGFVAGATEIADALRERTDRPGTNS